MTPEELEALTHPDPLSQLTDSWLADIPVIADHALVLLDRIQKKTYYDPSRVADLSRRCLAIEKYGIRPPRGYDLIPQNDFEKWIIDQERIIETKKLKRISDFNLTIDEDWTGLRW